MCDLDWEVDEIAADKAVAATARFWEVDCARTMAITMMVVYHVVYDVDFLAPGLGPDPLEGGWRLVPEATASLFLLLAGVSFTISDARARSRGLTGSRLQGRTRATRHAGARCRAGGDRRDVARDP